MRIAAKLLAALVLVFVAAGAFLAWRLTRGPIALGVLTPYIEATLNAPDATARVSVGATELAWMGWRRGVDLRAREVRVTATDGAVVANIPALAVRISVRALLRGRFALSRVDLLSPALRLVRETDGRIGLGLGAEATPRAESPVAADVFDALLASSHANTPTAYLRRIVVGDGEITVEDRGSGLVLRAPRLHLDLTRNGDGIVANLNGDLTLGNQVISLESRAQLQADPRQLDLELSFRGLNPAGLAAQLATEPAAPLAVQHPDLITQLAAVTMELAGSIHASLDRALHLTAARLELRGSSGSVSVPSLTRGRFDIKGVQLAAHFDATADAAVVDKLALDLGGASLGVTAHLTGLTRAAALVAEATLTGLPVDALARYWPAEAAPGARTWLTTNLSRGTVRSAKARLRGTLGNPLLVGSAAAGLPLQSGQQPAAPFALTDLTGAVAFERLTVRYIETMPPVTEVSGSGTFTADNWDLRVDNGVVRSLRVGPATVKISKITSKEPTRIAIAATVDGPLADALQVIDAEPLTIPRDIGIAPASVAGDMRAQVGFDFPLGGAIGLDNLGLDVSAALQQVRIPKVIEGWSVDGGNLQIAANGAGLDVNGRARLEGAPLDVEWHEAFARDAKERRRVVVKGQIDSASRTALGFDVQPWLDGPVGVDLHLTTARVGDGRIDLRLDLAPARIDVPQLGVRKATGTPGRAEGVLLMRSGAIVAVDPFEVTMAGCELRGRAARDGPRWSTIDADGTFGEEGADRGFPARFTLGVRPAGAAESFSLTSDDASALARAIGLYAKGQGGRLDVTGTADLYGRPHTFDTQVEIGDVTMTNAPVLARILTLASLSGIQRTLLNEGMKFNRISAQISGDTSTIDIADLVAVGDSVGVAGAGSIDRSANTINFAGSLVPAYYGINTTLEKIPVLRDLFSGKDGLGVLGVDFSVNGSLTDPTVAVHPLESLTPDIVGRFTRLLGGAPPPTPRATRQRRRR